jgi:hypothetical protein
MAIGALFSHVGENRLGVASGAGNLFVHAAQGIARRVMAEFGDGANGSPAGVCVAIFAGNVEGTVRTSVRLPLGLRRATRKEDAKREYQPTAGFDHARNDCPPRL